MVPTGAEELLAGLDDQQREAVTTPALPLCILAGAGSGKTRVLTRRIAWRCATGAEDPHHVLALTFTRAAAAELGARLRALGVREGVRAGTFHAVAWAELRTRTAEAGRTSPVLLERPARLLADAEELDRATATAVAVELAWARARLVPLDRYPAEAARAGRATSVPAERIVALGAAYEREKRKRGVVDFDDLLAHLTSAIAEDPGFAAAQRWRFAHLYVDEFQDLNPLQFQLLEQWRGGRQALAAVGDPNQAIYGWNGSDPAFVEGFTGLYPGATVVAVDRNYRSTAPILEAANAVLDAGGLGGVRLRSVRGEGPVPEVLGYAEGDDEAVAVARAVIDAKVPGTTWGQQAILARTNALLAEAEAALRSVGVPVRVHGRLPFHEEPVVRAALRELARPGAAFAETIAAIAAGVPSGSGPDHDDGEPATLARLVELAERFARECRPVEPKGFRAWLVHEADTSLGGDGVDLVTFHAAKGREWPVVHVFGAEEGYVPIAWARTEAAVAEERRLFYVACTRAERHLRITWSALRRFGDAEPTARRPSPFVVELLPALARRRDLERPVPPPSLPRTRPPDDDGRREALWRWRDRRARAAGIEPGALVPDAVLVRVLDAAPTDAEALAAVPGTRPLVLAGFADEVLDSLRGSGP